jgi:hypothetical protein
MSYITKYIKNISSEELIKKLKSIDLDISIENVKKFRVGDFIITNLKGGAIYGKIMVSRLYDNFSFELTDSYEIMTKTDEVYISDEVFFTVFPDLKIISFSSKEGGSLFGRAILSKVLFDDDKHIFEIIFDPQKVLDAKNKGMFSNVWFNGVRFKGKVQYQSQFGTQIDDDINFINLPDQRMGIGIVFTSSVGKEIKIAVYKEGTLLRHTKLKDLKEDLLLEKEIISCFLKYSDYGEAVPTYLNRVFPSLNDWN